MALLLWRPLRLYRNQQNWERLAICYRLEEVKRWRQQHGELTVERADKFQWEVDAVLENYYWYTSKRLERIEKRFWKVWRVYRGLVGVLEAAFGSRDLAFGVRGSGEEARDPGSGARDSETEARDSVFVVRGSGTQAGYQSPIANQKSKIENGESSITNPQSHLTNTETRVSSPGSGTLLQFRGTPHYEQFHPTWLERLDDLSPEAIGDPFQSPSHAMKAQQRRVEPATVKDPEHWQEHPPKPRRPEMDFSNLTASEFVRTPSERELRSLVRRGELTVPGSFEDFLALVEEALGARASRPQEAQTQAGETPALPGYLHALAESLWNRTRVFSERVAELRDLLEATLVWQLHRFLRLWLKMLPVEYAYANVDFFERTHGPNREDLAWGDDETTPPWRDCKQRPAEVPRSEVEGRKKHAGELQHALRIWLVALGDALVPVMRGTHNVKVALYEWAVSRFGIREEFLVWRPNLSLAQLETRSKRPEWAVRVLTATGKTLVKLRDGRVFEPAG